MSFNLHFPEYMTNAFAGTSRVGNSTGILLSVDCLLLNSKLVDYFDNIAYVKMAALSLIPPVIILVTSILYKIAFFKDNNRVVRYICVTSITIFFILHPTLTSYCLRIFK